MDSLVRLEVLVADEAFAAFGAGERLLTSVVPLVDYVVLFGGEALSTLVAKILLLLGVLLLVCRQCLVRGEADATFRAAKRRLHRVHSLVDVEVLLAAEPFPAFLAAKWFHPQVSLLVSEKPLAAWKPFPTFAAQELLLVAPLVVAKGSGTAKGFATLRTGVSLFIGVCPLVSNQVRLLGERLGAFTTHEGFLARMKLLVLKELGLAAEAFATLRANH